MRRLLLIAARRPAPGRHRGRCRLSSTRSRSRTRRRSSPPSSLSISSSPARGSAARSSRSRSRKATAPRPARSSPTVADHKLALQTQALDSAHPVAAGAARQGQDRPRPRQRAAAQRRQHAGPGRRGRAPPSTSPSRTLDGDARRPQRHRPADERGRGARARRRPHSLGSRLGRARRLARRDDRDARRGPLHPAPATARAPRPVHPRRRQGADRRARPRRSGRRNPARRQGA